MKRILIAVAVIVYGVVAAGWAITNHTDAVIDDTEYKLYFAHDDTYSTSSTNMLIVDYSPSYTMVMLHEEEMELVFFASHCTNYTIVVVGDGVTNRYKADPVTAEMVLVGASKED